MGFQQDQGEWFDSFLYGDFVQEPSAAAVVPSANQVYSSFGGGGPLIASGLWELDGGRFYPSPSFVGAPQQPLFHSLGTNANRSCEIPVATRGGQYVADLPPPSQVAAGDSTHIPVSSSCHPTSLQPQLTSAQQQQTQWWQFPNATTSAPLLQSQQQQQQHLPPQSPQHPLSEGVHRNFLSRPAGVDTRDATAHVPSSADPVGVGGEWDVHVDHSENSSGSSSSSPVKIASHKMNATSGGGAMMEGQRPPCGGNEPAVLWYHHHEKQSGLQLSHETRPERGRKSRLQAVRSVPEDSDGDGEYVCEEDEELSDEDYDDEEWRATKRLKKSSASRRRNKGLSRNSRGKRAALETSSNVPTMVEIGASSSHAQPLAGVRPFACSHPGCVKTFTTSSNLKRHEMIHRGERPFECHCGKTFSQRTHLIRHQKKHG